MHEEAELATQEALATIADLENKYQRVCFIVYEEDLGRNFKRIFLWPQKLSTGDKQERRLNGDLPTEGWWILMEFCERFDEPEMFFFFMN